MRSRLFGLLLVGVSLILAACGETTGGGSGGGTVSGTPSGQEATKSPSDIVADATNVLEGVDAYSVSFSGTDNLGPFSFTLNVDTQSNATGTMTQNGQTSLVVYSGSNMYVQERGLAQLLWHPPLDASFTGKWVVLPATVIPFIDTLRTPTILAQCVQDFANQTQTGTQTTVGGVSAVPLIFNDGNGNKNVITVALDGTAHLLSWEVKASPSSPQDCLGGAADLATQLSWAPTTLPIGTFTFGGYQTPVNVVVPSTTLNAPVPTETPTA